MTNLGGQLFVRDIEAPEAAPMVKLMDEVERPFFLLPFTEAIEFFRSRQILSPDDYRELDTRERSRSFSIVRAISERVVTRIKRVLDNAMEVEGIGLQGFIDWALGNEGSGIDAADLPGGARGYLENVYRTSTATSYGAGRLRMQSDPALAEAGLVWRYLTAGDDRVRSSHAALNNSVWDIGSADGLRVYSPNGFNCRCVLTVARREDIASFGGRRMSIPEGTITPGFEGSPDEEI